MEASIRNTTPCHFPRLVKSACANEKPEWETVSENGQHFESEPTTNDRDTAIIEAAKLAWALVLGCYTLGDEVCFGFVDLSSEGSLISCPLKYSQPVSSCLQDLTAVTDAAGEGTLSAILEQVHAERGIDQFNSVLHATLHGRSGSNPSWFASDLLLELIYSERIIGYGMDIRLCYNTANLDVAHARSVLSSFTTALRDICNRPAAPLSAIKRFSDSDRQELLHWNQDVPKPPAETVDQILHRHFLDIPDQEAVYAWDGTLTYHQVDQASKNLAIILRMKGVTANKVVVVCLDKSKWVPVVLISIVRSGGAFVIVDPTHPDERIQDISHQVQSELVITTEAYAHRLRYQGREVLTDVESMLKTCEQEGESDAANFCDLGRDPHLEDTFTIVFTSGSTGRPKGIVHTHRSACASISAVSPALGYVDSTRALNFSSYAFMPGVWEIFRCLAARGTVCIPSEDQRTTDIGQFIREARVSQAFFTPSFLRTLRPKAAPSLEWLLVGGEPVDDDVLLAWGKNVKLMEVYGQSEGAAMSRDRSSDVLLGLTAADSCAWVCDPNQASSLSPLGAVGELVIESYSVAKCYLDDPEKSRTTFSPQPEWAKSMGRPRDIGYLRTGDLARLEPDSRVTLLGRADTQVKVHGQRIELREIESSIRKLLPDTDIAVDLVRPSDAGDQALLTAFLQLPPTYDNNEDSVVSHLRADLPKSLPRYMVPRVFVFRQLPYNSSRKIDRKALKAETGTRTLEELVNAGSKQHEIVPQTDWTKEELVLRRLWSKTLHQKENAFRKQSDFVEVGGDSLAAIKLVAAARDEGLGLTTHQALVHTKLEDMSRIVEPVSKLGPDLPNGSPTTTTALIPARPPSWIEKSNIAACAPATDFQTWAVEAAASVGGWIDHLVYDLRGNVDVAHVEACCKKLVSTHSILRTVFIEEAGRTLQIVLEDYPLEIQKHHLEDHESVDELSKSLYTRDAVRPAGEPIVRFDLIVASESHWRLIMRLSHAQYDAFCSLDFGQHLSNLYAAAKIPGSPPFHAYATFAEDSSRSAEAKSFWLRKLKGSRMLPLAQRSGKQTTDHLTDCELRASVTLPELKSGGGTTATIVKAAWALTLAGLTNSTDVVFGDLVSGRRVAFPGVESIIGPCMNFLPFRVRLLDESGRPLTNRQLLGNIQRDQIECIPYEAVGFRRIANECTTWENGGRFSSIVNFVNVRDIQDRQHDTWCAPHGDPMEVQRRYEERTHDKTDLWLMCIPERHPGEQDTLRLFLRYSASLFTRSAVENILSLYCEALREVTTKLDDAVHLRKLGMSAVRFAD